MKQILVIGAGPAGYPAALKAASLGAQVVLVEKNKPGGVCLHAGCIPSKSMLDAAHRFSAAFSAVDFCAEGAREKAQALFEMRDWAKICARQQAATRRLTQGIGFLLKKANVTVIEGTAELLDAHTVIVHTAQGDQTFTPQGIILATGSEAFLPPPFDKWKDKIYDNSTVFNMPQLPSSMVIVGGGVIGCEMADLFNTLGVQVDVLEMQPRILPLEEESAARVVAQSLSKRGVRFHVGVAAQAVQETANGFEIHLSDGTVLQAQTVLAAVGRSVDLSALHAERAGITWTRKGVQVNPQTMQLKEHIYAAGDITGLLQLAHAATRQGEVAAANLCGVPVQYHNERVPRAIYTTPELAAVGLTARQAKEQGIEAKTHKIFFLANGRAVAQGQTEGYAELVSEVSGGRLLGGVIVGGPASELIHVLAVALAAGMNTEQLREVIFAHPTFAEIISEAAG